MLNVPPTPSIDPNGLANSVEKLFGWVAFERLLDLIGDERRQHANRVLIGGEHGRSGRIVASDARAVVRILRKRSRMPLLLSRDGRQRVAGSLGVTFADPHPDQCAAPHGPIEGAQNL